MVSQNKKAPLYGALFSGSPGRTRTANLVVNSHPLCRLSYRGILIALIRNREVLSMQIEF